MNRNARHPGDDDLAHEPRLLRRFNDLGKRDQRQVSTLIAPSAVQKASVFPKNSELVCRIQANAVIDYLATNRNLFRSELHLAQEPSENLSEWEPGRQLGSWSSAAGVPAS